MPARRTLSRFWLAAVLALASTGSALGVRRTEDPLALVPADAATVGVIHWDALRSSPLASQIFSRMDHVSVDGDAARFLADTGLTPREDIDTMVLAMTRGDSRSGDGLVIVEGRFDLARIGKALESRGATLETGTHGAYYRLPDGDGRDGAVALVNARLVVAGTASSVTAALDRRESGGGDGLLSGQGLGRELGRVDRDASAWALVDLTRFPATRNRQARVQVHIDGEGGEPTEAVVGAMKSVSLLALQARVHGDAVDVEATGVTTDAENRDLLADSLRGVLAMWRLAVQEKSPELVSVIRRFRVESDGDGVSIRGTLPGSFLRSLAANHQASAR